jgi:sialate O-acetylesterase
VFAIGFYQIFNLSIRIRIMDTQKRFSFLAVMALATTFCVAPARADVKLPAMFGDHMVLQRDTTAPVWGWADAGESVSVTAQGQTQKTKAGADGKWSVTLKGLKTTSKGIAVKIQGKNTITLKDVLVGEVWFCSGQSNMQWALRSSANAEAEIAAANYPNLRLISVPLLGTQERQDDFEGAWTACTPESATGFSAVGYFFGRKLHKDLDIPVGLIQ